MAPMGCPRVHVFTTRFKSNSNIRPLQRYTGGTTKGSDLLGLKAWSIPP